MASPVLSIPPSQAAPLRHKPIRDNNRRVLWATIEVWRRDGLDNRVYVQVWMELRSKVSKRHASIQQHQDHPIMWDKSPWQLLIWQEVKEKLITTNSLGISSSDPLSIIVFFNLCVLIRQCFLKKNIHLQIFHVGWTFLNLQIRLRKQKSQEENIPKFKVEKHEKAK